ncbi:NTP transferase domain-containing protein [Nitriliruptoraceae bacterium ZYF776]|nr:NTP transferase domain-containing protein [Profundirhabdus halotolerans]
MRAVILCGGKGTRAYPHTEVVPKPLLPVAGEPVLAHVLRIYADQGVTEFILSAGYLADRVVEFARSCPSAWDLEVVDTGEEANTADRIVGVRHLLDGTFYANYADGLGDVDLDALLTFHKGHPGAATLTTVPLPSQYGTIEADATGCIERFREKPRLPDHRINGGYFVFELSALDHFVGGDLERDVLPELGRNRELYAYAHPGFWKSMDTYKDAQELTELARAGTEAPWVRRSP